MTDYAEDYGGARSSSVAIEERDRRRARHGRQCGWDWANCPDRAEHEQFYSGPLLPAASPPGTGQLDIPVRSVTVNTLVAEIFQVEAGTWDNAIRSVLAAHAGKVIVKT